MKKNNIISFGKIFASFFIFPILYPIFLFLLIELLNLIPFNGNGFVDDGLTPPGKISIVVNNIIVWLTGILGGIMDIFSGKILITLLILIILTSFVLYFKKIKLALYSAHIIFIGYILYHFDSNIFAGM